MNNNTRFYWIKLKTNFFNQETIDFLLSQKNGCEYIVLYQMLCLNTANNNGEMCTKIGEMIIPYDIDKIVRDTKYFDYDTVAVGLTLFKQLGLVYEENDKILKISNFDEMVGSETSSAKRVREYRRKQKALHCNKNVTQEYRDKSIEYRDKNIDIEKDIDNNNNIIENNNIVDFDKSTTELDENKSDEYDKSYGGKIDQDNFNLIWAMYPKKQGKIEAFNQFCKWTNGRKVKIGKSTKTIKITAEQIYDFVEDYAKKVRSYKDPKFIKNGATFFGLSLMDYLNDDDIEI